MSIDSADLPFVEATQERLVAFEHSPMNGAKASSDGIDFEEHEEPPQMYGATNRSVDSTVLVP